MTHPAFKLFTTYTVQYLEAGKIHTDIRVSRGGWYVVERQHQGIGTNIRDLGVKAHYAGSREDAEALADKLRIP